MRFAVLGSLTAVDDDGGVVAVTGAKARSLLAVLLLEPNRTVPSESVMAVLWGEEPPPTATASLHNHVARLRRSLHDTDGTRLLTRPHGLELRVVDGELDRDDFEVRIRRAEEARNRADWATAEREAGAALELWRGTPFTDIPALAGHPAVTFLQEQRLRALECRYEALLHLDRLDGLAPELGVLVKEHPFREALHRQLMLVLGRTDRRAEALAVFRALRRTLVEELGVEPGPAVQEAHREVLHGTPDPCGPREPKPPRLAQLPSSPREFVGRAEQIAEIRAALESDRHRTALAVISGMPGVGKTGLALHLAEQLRDAFPDGQLYLHLHGATPGVAPLEPADALAVLLRGLGMDARRIPYDVAASSALLRSALARTRTLLVLDDAASVSQVRPLLPAGAGCAVLLTSRRPLATLESSAQVRLEPLSPRESALLLERASGRSWGASDAEPVARLVALCGHLPLALRVSAARLRSRRSLPVAKLVERLDQEDRLDHLELEDLSVRRSLLARRSRARATRSTARPRQPWSSSVPSTCPSTRHPWSPPPRTARNGGPPTPTRRPDPPRPPSGPCAGTRTASHTARRPCGRTRGALRAAGPARASPTRPRRSPGATRRRRTCCTWPDPGRGDAWARPAPWT